MLDRLIAMPVFAWNPKGRNAHVSHYGPTAQDFRAAFALGEDDTMIGTQDAVGVALAAIQGLNAKHDAERGARDAEIVELRAEFAAIRRCWPGATFTALRARSAARFLLRSTESAAVPPTA